MQFADLNWFDIKNYLQEDDRLMLVLGACEQHAYLSLLTDVKIPLALADAASRQTGVLVAPPLNFGCSSYFLAYPGTLSLRVSTILSIVTDMIRSAHKGGFRRLLILNGHSGNAPAHQRILELADELPDLQLAWYAWYESHSVVSLAQEHDLKPAHANWLEAFPFTQVAELPEGEKMPPYISGLLGPAKTRQVLGDGSFGGPYRADEGVMNAIFNAAVEDVLHLLNFV